jgi:hypothetical protein
VSENCLSVTLDVSWDVGRGYSDANKKTNYITRYSSGNREINLLSLIDPSLAHVLL